MMDHKEQATLPEHVTVIRQYPNMPGMYIVDGNLFKEGDIAITGRKRYEILSEPTPYGDNDSSYWVIKVDPAPFIPEGTLLMKENFKN